MYLESAVTHVTSNTITALIYPIMKVGLLFLEHTDAWDYMYIHSHMQNMQFVNADIDIQVMSSKCVAIYVRNGGFQVPVTICISISAFTNCIFCMCECIHII